MLIQDHPVHHSCAWTWAGQPFQPRALNPPPGLGLAQSAALRLTDKTGTGSSRSPSEKPAAVMASAD